MKFRYKPEYAEGERPIQYGLIAEEVAEVHPELVQYGEDGRPFTVRYQLLIPLLLNEVQKQHLAMEQKDAKIAALKLENEGTNARVAALERVVERLIAERRDGK